MKEWHHLIVLSDWQKEFC